MYTSDREGGIEVVLYERSELPPPAAQRATAVCERLESFADGGHIDGVTREQWVKRMPLGDADEDLRDTYLRFTSWADENGVRLTPYFQIRQCFTPEAGEHTDWLVMPAFCLAVYDDDGVSAVYPHTDDSGAQTVEDGLQALLGETAGDTAVEPQAAD
jgi:hypothetical protein